MKAAQLLTLDGRVLRELKPIDRVRRQPAWAAVALVALLLALLVAALPPRLADICGQDGSLACGP